MDIVLLMIGIVTILMLGFVIVRVNTINVGGSGDDRNNKDNEDYKKTLVEFEILRSKL